MYKYISKIIIFSMATILPFACNSGIQGENKSEQLTNDIESRLIQLGFDPADAVFKDDRVVVEGDMSMSIDELMRTDKAVCLQFSNNRCARPAGRACVFRASNLPRVWKRATAAAVRDWKAAGVPIDLDCNGGTRIDINFSPLEIFVVAEADVIGGSSFGRRVTVNSANLLRCGDPKSRSQASAALVMRHEIGHLIGLVHPDEAQFGTQIPGTQITNDTVMRTPIGCDDTGGLTADDRAAARHIFGE